MPGEWNWLPSLPRLGEAAPEAPMDDVTAQLMLKRRLNMADLLGQGEAPQGQMVSGHYVAPSWTQNLANVAGKLVGAQQEREAFNQYGQFQKGRQAKIADLLAGKEVQRPVDLPSALPGQVETVRQPYTQQEFMAKAAEYMPELGSDLVKAQAQQYVKNKGIHIVPAGGVMLGDTGEVIYQNPKTGGAASRPFVPPKQTYVVGGEVVSERYDPESQTFKEIGRGPAYKQTAPAEATLSPSMLNSMADQAIAGDKSVFTNIGRGAQGSANIVALRGAIDKKLRDQGLTGKDLAAANAEFAGITASSRSVATKAGNIAMAATEAEKVMPLALAASDKVVRSGFLPFGKVEVMFNAQTNNPALREFATANNALVNIYSRAISPTGNPTVSDKEHARELLSTAYDQKSYNAIVMQMKKEIEAAIESPKEVRRQIRESITGRTERTMSSEDQEALKWANSNPRDPRARAIKQKLGIQ